MAKKTQHTLGFSDHATTFGGNPIITAGAGAVLAAMTPDFLQEVTEKGAYITAALLDMPQVVEVSGKGLMLGITLAEGLDNRSVVAALAAEGVILLTAKHKLRMLPPLTMTYEEIDIGLGALRKVLAQEEQAI